MRSELLRHLYRYLDQGTCRSLLQKFTRSTRIARFRVVSTPGVNRTLSRFPSQVVVTAVFPSFESSRGWVTTRKKLATTPWRNLSTSYYFNKTVFTHWVKTQAFRFDSKEICNWPVSFFFISHNNGRWQTHGRESEWGCCRWINSSMLCCRSIILSTVVLTPR